MSSESALFVRLTPEDGPVLSLIRDIRAADARARKALLGERTDIVRIESLSSQLERLAATVVGRNPQRSVTATLGSGFVGPCFIDRHNLHERPPEQRALIAPWIAQGDIAVELRLPLGPGPTSRAEVLGSRKQPRDVWHLPPEVPPKKAAALRFQRQIAASLIAPTEPARIEPSGVSNTILTETLRTFVKRGGSRVDVPVRYRDGSIAAPFPLRCLSLLDAAPTSKRVLRFAMLSIRHAEMDSEVDGCWLRNYDVSRPRPAAETDQLVYDLTKRQLAVLTATGPLVIRLYQTGLDSAVVGFYRALVHQLLAAPQSVAVIPMYFRHPPRAAEDGPAGEHSYFAEGKPWML